MPFELQRPDPNTPVTNATEIDYADIPLECGLVYDISVAHAVNNVPAQYASLSAALGTSGANIPQNIRRGGMAVKFISSGTGKYEQWVLKSRSFSTTESDWMSVTNVNAEDVSYGNSNVKEELDKIAENTANNPAKDIYGDKLYICDAAGNVVAKIDNNGVKSVDFTDKNNRKLSSLSNKVDKVSGKGLSTNDYTNEDKEKLANLDLSALVDSEKSKFFICDASGNVVFKIDSHGVNSSQFNICDANGNIVKTLGQEGGGGGSDDISIIDDNDPTSLNIADLFGNVLAMIKSGFKVDEYGNVITKIFNSGESAKGHFEGKKAMVLGDSLSEFSQWIRIWAENVGAVFDRHTNFRHYSYGGTQTLDESDNCGMIRAQRIVEDQFVPDVIFIQNINDSNRRNTPEHTDSNVGDKDSEPFMLTDVIKTNNTYASLALAESAFMTEVGAITPKVGTYVKVPYTQTAYSFVIALNGATAGAGNITIQIGNDSKTATVTSGMSLQEVAHAIIAYDYTDLGYNDNYHTSGGVVDGAIFSALSSNSSPADVNITADASVGITITKSNTSVTNRLCKAFYGHDVSKWNNSSNWKSYKDIPLWGIYKGLIEYLQTNFPQAEIYFMISPNILFDKNRQDFHRADGSYNWDAFWLKQDWLSDCQKAVSDYMRIEAIDIAHKSGMTIYNASTYYPNNNVHPLDAGYEHWANVLTRLLN